MKLASNTGLLLLSIWLILTGVVSLFNVNFEGLAAGMNILAIAAGAFILTNR